MLNLEKLKAISCGETADCVIYDPNTNEPLLVLVVAGPTHAATKALEDTDSRRLASAIERARDPQSALKKHMVGGLAREPSFEREVAALLARTLGWKGADGEPSADPYDAKAMEALYRAEDKWWLRRQVHAFIAAEDSFTKSSQTK